MVLTKAINSTAPEQLDDRHHYNQQHQHQHTNSAMLNHSNRPILAVRYNKAPVYTSDKRAKFTQRENKKWVRLATVIGYLISVCIPAVALSIYYVGFWDPKYEEKVLMINETNNKIVGPLSSTLEQQQQQAIQQPQMQRKNREIRSHTLDFNDKTMTPSSANPTMVTNTEPVVVVTTDKVMINDDRVTIESIVAATTTASADDSPSPLPTEVVVNKNNCPVCSCKQSLQGQEVNNNNNNNDHRDIFRHTSSTTPKDDNQKRHDNIDDDRRRSEDIVDAQRRGSKSGEPAAKIKTMTSSSERERPSSDH